MRWFIHILSWRTGAPERRNCIPSQITSHTKPVSVHAIVRPGRLLRARG